VDGTNKQPEAQATLAWPLNGVVWVFSLGSIANSIRSICFLAINSEIAAPHGNGAAPFSASTSWRKSLCTLLPARAGMVNLLGESAHNLSFAIFTQKSLFLANTD
jgi:hypothetical protein